MSAQGSILLVSSDPDFAALLQSLLIQAVGHPISEVHWVQSVDAAIRLLDAEPGCTVLLDEPDGRNMEGLAALCACEVPVIVLVNGGAADSWLSTVRAGAQDYLVKGGFDARALAHALQYAVQRKAVESALVERSLHDVLTGLPKRPLLLDRLGVAMRRCARDGSSGALLLIELTGLKQIKQAHGHAAGNQALSTVGARLAGLVRSSDSVARIGASQFAVLLPKESGLLEALAIGEKLIAALREPLSIDGDGMELSADIGVARFRDATESPENLVQRANDALPASGKDAKGRVRLL